jgi:uncharacterized protein (UPF0548 family)
MFLLKKPSTDVIKQFISSQENLPYTYPEAGATRGELPPNYTISHNRVLLGSGSGVYERAVDAIKNWQQFDLGWVQIVPKGIPLVEGATVAIMVRSFGVWSLSAARVVYLINEATPLRTFGFAYGTLPDHVERGEERFTIEWHADDSIWYDILAFSQPQHPLAKLGGPLTRSLQKRFARDSLAVMLALT